ncbi:DUF4123 domain-containing protein [Polyangium jinanense]|uniref:DUF4123 domain-containing protein n=1 Tax=Polyangium jinanense TaxID=2829994 RepID=A0A9X3WWX5_9BACT|nr:DUF4123 domain-containing protein [Polyangium jinanense]MDC3953112.1 DUF4123 domain-containing protein [Polyangium jinanense]MDC3979767.1 DUF4123 domain-containing protein [Polyangium jinanense]
MTEPRLIVEVRYGKLAGTKTVIDSGRGLRVGRTDLADLVIAHDMQMSGTHFELQWDGARCALRDLHSQSGTRLGGQAVEQGEVPHGGWIQAGETDFMVYVEGKTNPPVDFLEEDELAREQARVLAAEQALFSLRSLAGDKPLYAVLDMARDRRILALVREHVELHRSLYDGPQGETFEDVAPYLVGPMRRDSALLDRLVREGFGKRWGIYCTSDEKFVEVRRHFRRFLMVELDETGEQVYFRFYDPGVARVFWPTCNAAQRTELYGTLGDIFVEGKDLSLLRLPR